MIRSAALLLLLAASLGLGWKALPGRTPVLTGPDPIAVLEPVAIGGMTQWLLIRAGNNAADLRWLEGAIPEALKEHVTYVAMMQMLDRYGGGMNVPSWRLAAMLIRAPEYSLGDLWRWLDGANRGSGPMWPDYRARDLIAELPVMPVPMLLISGARDLNTPVELAAEWFEGVEARQGKRHEVFDASGHAPFLTEAERFTQTVRDFAQSLHITEP